MPNVKSPISNKTYPRNQMREITVSDESDNPGMQQVGTGNSAPPPPPLDMEAVNAFLRSANRPPITQGPPVQQAQHMAPVQGQYQQQGVPTQMDIAEFQEARRAKVTGKERLSMGAKQRIDMLLGASRMTKEVDIDGNKYVLQSLRGKDQQEVWIAAAGFESTVQFPFELRKHTLARALSQVAGTDLEMFLGDDSLESKLEFLDLMDDAVLGKLFTEYSNLSEEAKNKYTIKTEGDAKDVAADLKK